jgi:hypothetical protein
LNYLLPSLILGSLILVNRFKMRTRSQTRTHLGLELKDVRSRSPVPKVQDEPVVHYEIKKNPNITCTNNHDTCELWCKSSFGEDQSLCCACVDQRDVNSGGYVCYNQSWLINFTRVPRQFYYCPSCKNNHDKNNM